MQLVEQYDDWWCTQVTQYKKSAESKQAQGRRRWVKFGNILVLQQALATGILFEWPGHFFSPSSRALTAHVLFGVWADQLWRQLPPIMAATNAPTWPPVATRLSATKFLSAAAVSVKSGWQHVGINWTCSPLTKSLVLNANVYYIQNVVWLSCPV